MEKIKFNDEIYEGEAIDGVPNGKGKFVNIETPYRWEQ